MLLIVKLDCGISSSNRTDPACSISRFFCHSLSFRSGLIDKSFRGPWSLGNVPLLQEWIFVKLIFSRTVGECYLQPIRVGTAMMPRSSTVSSLVADSSDSWEDTEPWQRTIEKPVRTGYSGFDVGPWEYFTLLYFIGAFIKSRSLCNFGGLYFIVSISTRSEHFYSPQLASRAGRLTLL